MAKKFHVKYSHGEVSSHTKILCEFYPVWSLSFTFFLLFSLWKFIDAPFLSYFSKMWTRVAISKFVFRHLLFLLPYFKTMFSTSKNHGISLNSSGTISMDILSDFYGKNFGNIRTTFSHVKQALGSLLTYRLFLGISVEKRTANCVSFLERRISTGYSWKFQEYLSFNPASAIFLLFSTEISRNIPRLLCAFGQKMLCISLHQFYMLKWSARIPAIVASGLCLDLIGWQFT